MNTTDPRFKQLSNWLDKVVPETRISLEVASADASFRRYFRLQTKASSYVIMDAPPDKEPITAFISAAAALKSQQVHVPEIYAMDEALGFVVLEDLGRIDYLQALSEQPDSLYADAIQTLIQIQSGVRTHAGYDLEHYDQAKLEQELDVFDLWYLQEHLSVQLDSSQIELWQHTKKLLIQACVEQPQVWVHRDFHSRNLMACETRRPGVIDFQDMVIGPIAYDVVSLFKDCYIEWPREQQLQWCEAYLGMANKSVVDKPIAINAFTRWFDLTGIQRHLKVLGVFARLHHRDGKSQYLNDLPLVRKYLFEALSIYPELAEFNTFFKQLPHAHDHDSSQ